MKMNFTRIAAMVCAAWTFATNMDAQTEKTWDFTVMSDNDKAAFQANIAQTGEWTVDGVWWYNLKAVGQNSKDAVAYADLYNETATKPLYTNMATKTEAEYTQGLHFGVWQNGNESTPAITKAIYKNFKIQNDKPRIYLAGTDFIIVIPNRVAGDSVEVTMAGNSATEARYLSSMNLTPAFKPQDSGFNLKFTRKAKVVNDGNVVLRSTGGCYVYDITIKDKDGNVLPKEKVTTGIGSTTLKDMQTTTSKQNIYNINGQFVGTNLATLPKGIYIQNGRKVIK